MQRAGRRRITGKTSPSLLRASMGPAGSTDESPPVKKQRVTAPHLQDDECSDRTNLGSSDDPSRDAPPAKRVRLCTARAGRKRDLAKLVTNLLDMAAMNISVLAIDLESMIVSLQAGLIRVSRPRDGTAQ